MVDVVNMVNCLGNLVDIKSHVSLPSECSDCSLGP